MPANRNALIRYKTIDKCLQNRYRRWTLEDLIEECSEALYEYEGIEKGISKRTIQLDIQIMRSDKLGYNAPIIVYDNKYYTYEDPEYSITNIPLTDQDLGRLSDAVEFMKQFKGFSHFRELDEVVQKLEDHVYSQKTMQNPVIDFEKNENLKGLEHLDVLYQSIIQRRSILLTYQSFKARQASSFVFHPYLLKEYRNRWFLIGAKKARDPLLTLALDRILDINPAEVSFIARDDLNFETYFKDAIGVTVSPNLDPVRVVLFISHDHAQYVLTKPLHSSQKLIKRDAYGITIELLVQLNFELEKEILSFGEAVMVLEPPRLKQRIVANLNNAADLYQTALSEKGILSIKQKIEHKGFAVANHMYPDKVKRQLGGLLNKLGYEQESKLLADKIDIDHHEQFEKILINRNIQHLVELYENNLSLNELYFYKCISDNEFNWLQSEATCTFSLILFLSTKKIRTFPIHAFPGSHRKKLTLEEKDLIVNSSVPSELFLPQHGVIILKPMLLKRFDDSLKAKKISYFRIDFGIPI
jgi:predicted DNA-binding transcriptional regulator YafY